MLTSRSVFIFLFISIIQSTFVFSFEDNNDDSISLNFEDNIEGRFTSFSKTNIRLSRQATLELIPSRSVSRGQYDRLIENQQENNYYTLKISYKRAAVQDHVMTSVPMCFILQSRFQYSVTLHLNENGFIVSAQLTTGNSTCSLWNGEPIEKKNDYPYKVDIRLQLNEAGPQPDIQSFLEKLKRQQEAKLNAQESDNRPFILKYWKYILPVVIIMLLQSVFTNEAGGGNGGGQ